MAGISINAPQGNPVDTLTTNNSTASREAREAKEKHQSARAGGAQKGQDTVTISAAARSSQAVAASASTLTDSDAQSQSISLRQLLNDQSLSGTAKQNQAILSLLR